MIRKLILLLTVFLLSGVPALMAEEKTDIDKISAEIKSRIRYHKLPNGLRVILMKNGVSPTIACYLKVGVGSSNEPFDQAGAAHFLEHLLFKGTESLGTLDYQAEKVYLDQIAAEGERYDQLVRRLGDPLVTGQERAKLQADADRYMKRIEAFQKASQKYVVSEEDSKAYSLAGQVGYNAYTTADVTNYQIKLPKNRLEMWADIESERFINPVFREFYAERKVILEERRMRYDSRPSAKLYELFLSTAFGLSPYGKPVIGTESNILKLRMSETRDFFNNNYTPSRIVIAIVGDIDFDQTIRIIENKFSRLKAATPVGFPPIELAPQQGKKTAVLEADHNPLLISGYRRPPITDKSDIVFEILSKALGSGQTSRLYKKLVTEKKLASSVGIYPSVPGERLANMFAFIAEPFEESAYPEIEKVIEEEISKIIAEGLTDREITRIKNRYESDLVNSLNFNAGLADTLTYYELLLNDYTLFLSGLKELEKVTNDQIKKVTAATFVPRNQTVAYIKKVKTVNTSVPQRAP